MAYKNIEDKKAYAKKWREKNPTYNSEWKKKNPNRYTEYNNVYNKSYYEKNLLIIKNKNKDKRLIARGKKKILDISKQSKEYRKNHPQWAVLMNIKGRCNYKYGKYYKNGIKNFLSLQDIFFLWERDNADLLKRPSIDRIDDSNHYTLENCRFIELSENCRRGSIKANIILKHRIHRL